MPNRQYNLNTRYGRRKARQQAYENYQNMTPEEQDKQDMLGCIIMLTIFIIIGALVLFAKGWDGFLKWLK